MSANSTASGMPRTTVRARWVGSVSDDAHHGRGTGECLASTSNPVNSCVLDAVLGEGRAGVAAGSLLGGLGVN